MTQYRYDRSAVPTGGVVKLEAEFTDSANNKKDPAAYPTVEIIDAAGNIVRTASSASVRRLATGKYRLEYTIPDGYSEGVWQDTWAGTVDGYALTGTFNIVVDASGSVRAAGSTVPVPEMRIGDTPNQRFTQDEIYGINILMQYLGFRLKNTQLGRDGQRCDIFSVNEMLSFLCAALSEFNATPTFTGYTFANKSIYLLFADIIVEGAYLKALGALMPTEASREFTLSDDGVSLQPGQVSSSLGSVLSQFYTEYRAKLKEAKRNHRPAPIGMGAGSILATNPLYRRLRSRKENRLI